MIDLQPWLGAVPEAVVERIRSARNVLAVGHENPDADTLGSTLAVCRLVECNVGIGIVPESTARRVQRTMAIAIVERLIERKLAYLANATEITPEHPVLIDRFLEDAIEVDVDAAAHNVRAYGARVLPVGVVGIECHAGRGGHAIERVAAQLRALERDGKRFTADAVVRRLLASATKVPIKSPRRNSNERP